LLSNAARTRYGEEERELRTKLRIAQEIAKRFEQQVVGGLYKLSSRRTHTLEAPLARNSPWKLLLSGCFFNPGNLIK
jgi:hypothetical protein